jgi:peroxiredoxin
MMSIRNKLRAIALLAAISSTLSAQRPRIIWSDREKPIVERLRKLRGLPDAERVATTRRLALEIRQLPAGANRGTLAESLANLVTEGDPGAEALQDVATTLALVLKQAADPPEGGFLTLAQLVRYEHVQVTLDDPRLRAAMAKLEADDRRRQNADFTLADLAGKRWNLKELRGSVVLVNFWATWCPPCRKEMPDLEALYRQFAAKGLVVLAISDEDAAKVQPFIAERQFTYPILLDPGRKVNESFDIEGIPKSFVFGREGKLVAQAIDMRTRKQFLAMLAAAGLE